MTTIRSGGAFLAVILILAAHAVAQTAADGELTNRNLEQLMKVQFYTASKHAEDASATPASVTVITRVDIRAYGRRNSIPGCSRKPSTATTSPWNAR